MRIKVFSRTRHVNLFTLIAVLSYEPEYATRITFSRITLKKRISSVVFSDIEKPLPCK